VPEGAFALLCPGPVRCAVRAPVPGSAWLNWIRRLRDYRPKDLPPVLQRCIAEVVAVKVEQIERDEIEVAGDGQARDASR